MPTPTRTPARPPQARSFATTTLIDRCLAGDAAAWEQLYTDLQPKLLRAVRGILRSQAADDDLVEEIVARIWFTLINRRYRSLKRFDQNRGIRISTYLTVLARYEWLQYCRSERRRVQRERQFARDGRREANPDNFTLNHRHEEFRETLTCREQGYWDYLTGDVTDGSTPSVSAANGWKLRQRIRVKLQRYAAEFVPG